MHVTNNMVLLLLLSFIINNLPIYSEDILLDCTCISYIYFGLRCIVSY
jgi:hypothetical protein